MAYGGHWMIAPEPEEEMSSWAGRVAQLAECIPHMHEALGQNPVLHAYAGPGNLLL